jgi:hypothetical protein
VPDIAATDVEISILDQRRVNGRSHNNVKLVLGDGSLTYPAGGVPLAKGKLGCPNSVESLVVYSKGASGYIWSYDKANEKLVAMAHGHDVLVKGGEASATSNVIAHYATDILGKEAASDAVIAGADSATKGGVRPVAESAEPSTVAIVEQTLFCEVVGW